MRKIPFTIPDIEEEEIKEVIDTLKSGWITTGPKTKKFEEQFAKYIGCKHAIAVNSCTGAMHLALLAYGIGKGDEVITTPYTFISTAETIIHTGATPVFVDIDPKTLNINPEKIEFRIRNFPKGSRPHRDGAELRIKAIMPVHIAGQPCDMDEILDIAKRYNLIVIEDAAHALSAEYKGKKIGTIGDVTCFSFYATKNLTTGEGGMITTDDTDLAEKMRILSLHGMSRDAWKRYTKEGSWYYEILDEGYKYNMSDIQSAIGITQLQKLEKMQERRKEIVEVYNEELKEIDEIITPQQKEGTKHAWHLYIIQIKPKLLKINRNEFIKELSKEGIGTSVHFIPLHLMPYYKKKYGFKPGDFLNAEYVYERAISLPLYSKLSKSDAQYVAKIIKKITKNNLPRSPRWSFGEAGPRVKAGA
ncbi:DegT/DnrJ/EryC1/StrS family aminotransferase [candidate division WOR-3 bacterium]|nr:DegT/DnrJ/EryC1/StrS family aminotransferase [candidate division WOR-3 bacterium]